MVLVLVYLQLLTLILYTMSMFKIIAAEVPTNFPEFYLIVADKETTTIEYHDSNGYIYLGNRIQETKRGWTIETFALNRKSLKIFLDRGSYRKIEER